MLLNVKLGAGRAIEMIRLIVEKRLSILATLWGLNRSR
jgi:hypothetical protein